MRTVLIIDDSRMQRFMVESMLERNGYMPMSASAARQGLHLARALQPDLVMVDLDPPEADALRLLRCMVSDARTRDIPLIAIAESQALRRRALLLGAQDYLVKPVTECALMGVLERAACAYPRAPSLPAASVR